MRHLYFIILIGCSGFTMSQDSPDAYYALQDSLIELHLSKGDYQTAVLTAQQLTAWAQKKYKPTDAININVLGRLGLCYYYTSQFEKAAVSFVQMAEAVQVGQGNNNTEYSGALSNAALMYEEMGQYAKALALYQRVLSIDKLLVGEQHPDYMVTLNNLAKLYYTMGAYDKAEPLFLKTLAYDKQHLKESDSDYITGLTNLGAFYFTMGAYTKSERFLTEALLLREQYFGIEHREFSGNLYSLGNLYFKIGYYSKAQQKIAKAIRIDEQFGREKTIAYANKLLLLGLIHQHFSDYENSEHLYIRSLKIFKELLGEEHMSYNNALISLANLYQQKGAYKESELINLKVLHTIKEGLGVEHPDYHLVLTNLANNYTKLEQLDKALKLYEQNHAVLLKKYGKEHLEIATNRFNIGMLHKDVERYEMAYPYLRESADIYLAVAGKRHPMYAAALGEMADCKKQLGAYHEAEKLLLQSLQLLKDIYQDLRFPQTTALVNTAAFYYKKEDYNRANQYIVRAVGAVIKASVDSSSIYAGIEQLCEQHDSWDDFRLTHSLKWLYDIQLKLFETTNDAAYLKAGLRSLKAICMVAKKQQRSFINKQDQLKVLNNASEASFDGLKAAQKLYRITAEPIYLEEALRFADNNKSILLSSSINNQQALSFGAVPDSLIQLEKALKQRKSKLYKTMHSAQRNSDSLSLSDAQQQWVELSMQQGRLQQKMQQGYPKYHQLMYQQEQLNTEHVQALLSDEQTIILEYFVHEESIFLTKVSNDTIVLYAMPCKTSELRILIRKFRKSLSNYKFIQKNKVLAYELYTDVAYSLYKKLVAPALQGQIAFNNIIIIPDAMLGHIPFGALLTESVEQRKTTDWSQLPYLLRDYRISYSYSLGLLTDNQLNEDSDNNGEVIAFAAQYSKKPQKTRGAMSDTQVRLYQQLTDLPSALKEVQSMQQLFRSGAYFTNVRANEKNFKENVADYSIIHLAMHGLLNKKEPLLSSLAFSYNGDSTEDNFLESHEISALDLNAQLVVLSACETGYGKFEQGEGVMSLGRSFMYAGVPSMLVSLWSVNDQSTAIIMQLFYQHLKAGQSISEALQQAKLNYLSTVKGGGLHPAFWSPFIHVGRNQHIHFKSDVHDWLYWFLGIGALLLFLSLLYTKSNKSSNSKTVQS